MELIIAKEAVKQLKQSVGVVISQQRFGRLKHMGAFKVHRKDNSRRDWFLLDEVMEGYFNYVNPRTEEQHKIRTEYYSQGKSIDEMIKEFTSHDIKIEEFDVPDHVAKEFKSTLVEINTTNMVLRDFTNDLLQVIEPIHHRKIKEAYKKACFDKEIAQDTLDTFIDEYEENRLEKIER